MYTKALFLDRDGVINIGASPGEYITSLTSFHFAPGALDIISYLHTHQIPIFVITNQQCIGKGITTREMVDKLHYYMTDQIHKAGGAIEKIMVCPHLASDGCYCRKPHPGMVLDILQKYPTLNKATCLLVGDSNSDIIAGKVAGIQTLHIEKDTIGQYYDQIVSFFS